MFLYENETKSTSVIRCYCRWNSCIRELTSTDPPLKKVFIFGNCIEHVYKRRKKIRSNWDGDQNDNQCMNQSKLNDKNRLRKLFSLTFCLHSDFFVRLVAIAFVSAAVKSTIKVCHRFSLFISHFFSVPCRCSFTNNNSIGKWKRQRNGPSVESKCTFF